MTSNVENMHFQDEYFSNKEVKVVIYVNIVKVNVAL